MHNRVAILDKMTWPCGAACLRASSCLRNSLLKESCALARTAVLWAANTLKSLAFKLADANGSASNHLGESTASWRVLLDATLELIDLLV